MSSIPCSWCGQPASRMYPGRRRKGMVDTVPDLYLCTDCDALAQEGKPLPQGVAQFSVAVREGLL